MLVVSYFVAQKINRSSLIFLIAVYSVFAIGMTREIFSLYFDLVRLGWEMADQFGSDGTLSWLGMANSGSSGPQWVIPIAVTVACGSAYVGSLFFFFQIRKRDIPSQI